LPVSHATVYLNNLVNELLEKKTKGKDYRKNPLIEAQCPAPLAIKDIASKREKG
jgi:hypothetical protein